MPVIDGRVVRSRFTSLKLRELSSVDNPAQPGARAAIMKRYDPDSDRHAMVAEIAKYVCQDSGAHSFQEVLDENKFDQNVWPCVDALSQAIRSIVGDNSLTGGERETQINASVTQFLQSVRDISPEVSKQLSELVRKRDAKMPKSIEELQADVGKLEGQVTDLTAKLGEAEKAKTDAMSLKDKAEADCKTAKTALDAVKAEGGELATVKAELATTKAALTAATDETIKVGETEIKKSVIGTEQFAMAKALADERDMAKLEKRAETELSHVVGTSAEKAPVLKSVSHLPEDNKVRKALEAILQSAERMARNGFDRLGSNRGEGPTEKAAQGAFKQKVDEIAKRDGITRSAAMSKARTEFPTEFEAAYPDSVDSNDAAAQ